MLAKLDMKTHCAAASRDLTPNEPVSKTEVLFQDDRFVSVDITQTMPLRSSQQNVWWSELDVLIQALPKLDVEAHEVDERLLNTLRTLGSLFSVNAIPQLSTVMKKSC